MKRILLLVSVVTLLTTVGCIFPGHRGDWDDREHGEYRGHSEYREHSQYRGYQEPGVDVRIHAE